MMKVPSYFVNMSHLYLIYITRLYRFLPYPLHTYKTYEVSYANRYLTRPCTSYTYEKWRLSSSQSSHTCMLCTFEDRKISIAYTYKTLKNLAYTHDNIVCAYSFQNFGSRQKNPIVCTMSSRMSSCEIL